MTSARTCFTRYGGHGSQVAPQKFRTEDCEKSSRSSSCPLYSTICKSGATRSTLSIPHCPKSTRKAMWHCGSGRLNSPSCRPLECRLQHDRPGGIGGAAAHRDHHPRGPRCVVGPDAGLGALAKETPSRCITQHRAAVTADPGGGRANRALPGTAAARREPGKAAPVGDIGQAPGTSPTVDNSETAGSTATRSRPPMTAPVTGQQGRRSGEPDAPGTIGNDDRSTADFCLCRTFLTRPHTRNLDACAQLAEYRRDHMLGQTRGKSRQ